MNCPLCLSATGAHTLSCPACGEPLPLVPGSLIDGRYEVIGRLGSGGMGTVFKARDLDLKQLVAVKVVRLDRGARAGERFRSEIRLARRVKHRNVCSLWANGYEGEVAYIVMELVEGQNLRQLLHDRGLLPWVEACDIAVQAADGLQAIHEVGVIHRDLKATNLMIDARGVVRLVDFGIAKAGLKEAREAQADSSITDTGQVVGSVEYMSPEQVRAAPLDARSDIYSFGVVLYELFTGQVPFRGDTPTATMIMHLEEPPPLDGPVLAVLPRGLVPILRRTLAKNVHDRYATTRELLADLRRLRSSLDGLATESQAVSAPRRRWFRFWLPTPHPMVSGGSPSIPGGGRLAASLGPPPPLPAEAGYLVPKLADGLRHRDAQVRTRAAGMLARLGAEAKAARPALVAALDDEDAAVRAAASAALGRLIPDQAPAVDSKPATEPSGEEPPGGPSLEEPPPERGIRARIRLAMVALLALLVVIAAGWRLCASHVSGPSGPGAPAASKTE